MIEFLQTPDHVIALRISGRLTGADYDRLMAETDARLARQERLGVLMDLTAFEDVTAEAAWKDLRYDLSMLSKLKRFPRQAVVSDKAWMHTVVRFAGPLIPFVEMRAFHAAERDSALAWVSDIDPRPR